VDSSLIVQNIDGVLWIGTDRGVSTLRINSLGTKKLKSKKIQAAKAAYINSFQLKKMQRTTMPENLTI
jgi:ligand-binding sensor domain-containing protein